MAIKKRYRWEVDVIDNGNGRQYTYSVGPCETPEKAMRLAMKEHGEKQVEWVGNPRIQR